MEEEEEVEKGGVWWWWLRGKTQSGQQKDNGGVDERQQNILHHLPTTPNFRIVGSVINFSYSHGIMMVLSDILYVAGHRGKGCGGGETFATAASPSG